MRLFRMGSIEETHMPSIDWHNIRPWKGSQHAAFEELICQLVATEPAPAGSKFIRKGAPDAGVECFVALPNGEEHGWQAKFFRAPPDSGQWSQIDDSVGTALEKHPQLTQYTICLPLDRPDPRRDDQTSFLERWNQHAIKWEKWATAKSMAVRFAYWGDHEIGLRLTSEAHRGRLFYWFREEKLSDRWFSERVEETVSNVGPRYTPHLNVSLPTARLFDGLGRTVRFYNRIDDQLANVKKHFSDLMSWVSTISEPTTIEALRSAFLGFIARTEAMDRSAGAPIDFSAVLGQIDEIHDLGRACVHSVRAVADATNSQTDEERGRLVERYGHFARMVHQLLTNLDDIGEFCKGGEAQLASRPYLLLVGDAGTGKTHLFCDVAMRRIRAAAPTILLNGNQFTNQEPWTQILLLLGLDCSKDEFLGALDALAEARGTRALIMIDALNEGEGKQIWGTHLAGLLLAVSRFPRIGVALSVRTSYENIVIPLGLVPDRLHREEHHGFEDHEFEAATSFFRHYKIEQPSVPLLVPEFRNPLFLKLFCEGLRNRGLSRIPSGLAGVTAIFDFFIGSVEAKLSSATFLDYDPASRAARKAITLLARRMAEVAATSVPRAECAEIVNQVLPSLGGFERTLFRHLISEGVLLEDRRYAEGGWIDVIHFCYERFSDHMIASALLDEHLNPEDVAGSFHPESPLGRYCASPHPISPHQGLLNAFAVQLPERAGVELHDVASRVATSRPLQTAFIESLVWRDPHATTPTTRDSIAEILAGTHEEERCLALLDALVMVGLKSDHPFNADWLHEILWPIAMAKRDAWWSLYLHRQWYRNGAASILIRWAGSSDPKAHIDDTAIFLAATMLAWCLSSCNRFVRDHATKALVQLVDRRVGILRRLLDRFSGVNDPYVAERLHAVAFGCAVRSTDDRSVVALGQDVYDQVFRAGEPPADIMLRAYARETIEEAVRRGLSLSGDLSLIESPYRSDWVPHVPSKEELRLRAEDTGSGDPPPGLYALISSVLQGGDFTRYVLGTNSGGVPWSSIPLSEPIELRSMRFRFDRFLASLRPNQRSLWDEYTSLHMAVDLRDRIERFTQSSPDEMEIIDGSEETSEQEGNPAVGEGSEPAPLLDLVLGSIGPDVLESLAKPEQQLMVERSKGAFVAALDGDQRTEYEVVAEYPENRHRYDKDDAIDSSLVERWIMNRVLELGWRSDTHGAFDSTVGQFERGRDAHKPERIGKKYQWIALHECYGRLADNFHFRGDEFANNPQEYRGTWQLSVLRDIDPTCTFTGPANRDPDEECQLYLPPVYNWQRDIPDGEWLRTVEDFPHVRSMVSLVNPSDNEEWLALRCAHDWREPRLGPGRNAEYPYRRMYFLANAYLVSAADYEEMYMWARRQDYTSDLIPECRDVLSLYYREFYRSTAFEDTLREDPEMFGWTRGDGERLPRAVAIPLVQYIREASGFDCSIDETVALYLPAPMLVEGLGLRRDGREGLYIDCRGQLVALDTSSEGRGAATFAIRRREFEQFLKLKNLRVFWTVRGGKQIIQFPPGNKESFGPSILNGSLRLSEDGVEGHVSATMYRRGGNEVLGEREV
jgi:hypothetical protein